jgi:hypothetical protein
MQYYRELDLDNLDILIEKSLAYVKPVMNDVNSLHVGNWYSLDRVQLFAACPELEYAFIKYDLICNYAVAFIESRFGYLNPHIDADHHPTARINLPLLNCKNTRTEFFSNVRTERYEKTGPIAIINSDYILEDSFELVKATVIRVKEAHRVVIPKHNPIPRISLTLAFNKDPVFLLEQ